MAAQLIITKPEIPLEKIIPKGTPSNAHTPPGHDFQLFVHMKVERQRANPLSKSTDIQVPQLEWKEKIDWFSNTGGPTQWKFAGCVDEDLYATKGDSNTFKPWRLARFAFSKESFNNPPAELTALHDEDEIKAWIVKNGFEWKMPITDVPAMGLAAGSGGGGGTSLVTGNTRRRVVYFDLGFAGFQQRAQAVQILETYQGTLTIQKFIRGAVPREVSVDNAETLQRWRVETRTTRGPDNWEAYMRHPVSG